MGAIPGLALTGELRLRPQKTAVAVAHCKTGNGSIKLNGETAQLGIYALASWVCALAAKGQGGGKTRATMPCLAGAPLELVQPDILRFKAFEPVLLLGRNRLKNLDIRLRVKGGGHVSQIYGGQEGEGRLCAAWVMRDA